MKKPIIILALILLVITTNAQWLLSSGTGKTLNTPKLCNPATNLEVNYTPECNAWLTWDAPLKTTRVYDGWIHKCWDDDYLNVFGQESTVDMIGTIRFTSNDLETIGIESGQVITKVMIGIGQDLNTISLMELRIWEGGTSLSDPGTLVVQQPITNYATFKENEWNEVLLNIPFVIDMTKELRIGYKIVGTAGFPFGFDDGPAVTNGNIFYVNAWGSWVNINNYIMGGGYFNLRFKAYVTSIGEAPDYYNLYRDDNLIKENYPLTSYIDYGSSPLEAHSWMVKVVCPEGESEPVSVSKPPCTLPTYSVSLSASPEIGGTVTGGGAYQQDATVTVTATANTGYTFTNWTKGGAEVSTDTSFSFTITEDISLTANFELTSYKVSVLANPPEGGIVFGNGTYYFGESTSVFASANTKYIFLNWADEDTVITTNEVYTFSVTRDVTLTANFELENGINDIEKYSGFSITPNPNPGTFQLETNFPLSEIASLKITNTLGAIVYETQHIVSNEIQLLNCGNGLYFMVMILKDGSVLTQKMMIQR
jgi:uncharacterized repeat protein (TIGR02543 family)